MKLKIKKNATLLILFIIICCCPILAQSSEKIAPIWSEIAKRPIPKWFQDAKLGIFIHWGPYSVPAYGRKGGYAEWYGKYFVTSKEVSDYHKKNYNNAPYRNFAKDFKAQNFKPNDWARLFKRAGASYAVLTTKHHDGFSLWDNPIASESRGHAWNSVEVGPRKDLVKEFSKAMQQENIKVGFYHSILEWYFKGDKNRYYEKNLNTYVDKVLHPSLKDLVLQYKPDLLWGDGNWEKNDKELRSYEFMKWLYYKSPVKDSIIINDRWFAGSRFHYGMYSTPEYGFSGNSIPNYKLKYWEECRGIGYSFGYNQIEDYKEYKTRTELIRLFVKIVGAGGKLLLNVGPTAEGTIPTIMEDRLVALGNFIKLYSNAIHKTSQGPLPLILQKGGSAVQIDKKNLYYFLFQFPQNQKLRLPMMARFGAKEITIYQENKRINERGEITTLPFQPKPLSFDVEGEDLVVDLKGKTPLEHATVFHIRFNQNIKKIDKKEIVAVSPSMINGRSCFIFKTINVLELKNGVVEEKYYYRGNTQRKLSSLTGNNVQTKVATIGGWKKGGYVKYALKKKLPKEKFYELTMFYSRSAMKQKLNISISFLDTDKKSLAENTYALPTTSNWSDFQPYTFKGIKIPKGTKYITITPMKDNDKIDYLMNMGQIIFTEE